VRDTGRMGIIWRRSGKGRQEGKVVRVPDRPLPPIAAVSVGELVLVLQGLSRREAASKFSVPTGL